MASNLRVVDVESPNLREERGGGEEVCYAPDEGMLSVRSHTSTACHQAIACI